MTGAARRRAVRVGHDLELIAERSFIVTDKPILEPFTFERVLDTLVARSGVPGLTSAQLYRQWFDTQNPSPGLADPAGPHCDDVMVGTTAMLNGFPRRRPTDEGQLAATPFRFGEYFPIELVNRFDMAPPNGANCGQYRMVLPRTSSKLHAIFEAFLPNPHPEQGMEGCRAVAQFSKILHMLQFRIARQCDGACTMRIVPDALENTAFGSFLDVSDQSDRAKRFRDEFIRQIPNLAISDLSRFFASMPTEFLIGDTSPSDAGTPPFIYDITFGRIKAQAAADEYHSRVQAELTRIGSTLTPENIVTRAETLNCIGCHFLTADVGGGVVAIR